MGEGPFPSLGIVMYYNRERASINVEEFLKLFENEQYRRVIHTKMPDGTEISTIWLGMDHGHGPNGPMIFETMIRPSNGKWNEQYRYSTQEEAIKHHWELVGTERHANTYDSETRWNQIGNDIE